MPVPSEDHSNARDIESLVSHLKPPVARVLDHALEGGDMDRRVTAMEGGATADDKAGDPG